MMHGSAHECFCVNIYCHPEQENIKQKYKHDLSLMNISNIYECLILQKWPTDISMHLFEAFGYKYLIIYDKNTAN